MNISVILVIKGKLSCFLKIYNRTGERLRRTDNASESRSRSPTKREDKKRKSKSLDKKNKKDKKEKREKRDRSPRRSAKRVKFLSKNKKSKKNRTKVTKIGKGIDLIELIEIIEPITIRKSRTKKKLVREKRGVRSNPANTIADIGTETLIRNYEKNLRGEIMRIVTRGMEMAKKTPRTQEGLILSRLKKVSPEPVVVKKIDMNVKRAK